MSSGVSVIHSDFIYRELTDSGERDRVGRIQLDTTARHEISASRTLQPRKKMNNICQLRLAALFCWLLIVPVGLSAGGKKKAPEQFGNLSFVVLRASDGGPV